MGMENWWGELTSPEQIFWGISIIFSVLFVIQFVLSLIGFDADSDADFGGEGMDTDFSIFSVRSVIAFFTFFGWTGIIALGMGLPTIVAALAGTAAGMGAMFIVAYIMYTFIKLESSGNLVIENAVDQTGKVYLVIPANKLGAGKVQIKVQGRLREMDALTEGKSIPTGAQIRVIDIVNNELLLVESISERLD